MTPSMTCARYLEKMAGMVGFAAAQYMAYHPILSKEDLCQEARLALVTIWNRFHQDKDLVALCKLGTVAIFYRMRSVRRCARRGAVSTVALVSADVPWEDDDGAAAPLRDALPADGIEDCYFWLSVDQLEAALTPMERCVLTEMVDPSDQTRAAFRWACRRLRRTATGYRAWWVQAIAIGLRVAENEVKKAMVAIQHQAQKIFQTNLEPQRYSWVGEPLRPNHRRQGGTAMDNGKGFIPDESELPSGVGNTNPGAPVEGEPAMATATATPVRRPAAKRTAPKAVTKAVKKAAGRKPGDGKPSQASVIDDLLREGKSTLDAIVKRVEAMGGRRGRVLARLGYLRGAKGVTIREGGGGVLSASVAGGGKTQRKAKPKK